MVTICSRPRHIVGVVVVVVVFVIVMVSSRS